MREPQLVKAEGLPERVTIYEVGPRDGLQNESAVVDVAVKAEFIRRLVDAGLTTVETTSFVHPKWVPQLADAAELLDQLELPDGVRAPVLVPNERGLDRALAAGVREIAIFASATETFAAKNLNSTLELSVIVLVMYDARTKLSDQVVQEVRDHFGDKVCRTIVPRTVRLSEAPSYGQPITAFDPSSRGAIAYRELAKEVSGGTP